MRNLEKLYFDVSETVHEKPSNVNFRLHTHNEYEIYMFLEGDAKYVVEGENYTLLPGDIIIIRKNEMHRIYHNSDTRYRRFVLMVSPEFFVENNCSEYEEIFLNSSKKGNKINSKLVHSSGIFDAIGRLGRYSDKYTKTDAPVIKGIITEILYLINSVSDFEAADTANARIKDVIEFINNNYTSQITLDELCERFFISKYHLCRIFKKATGLTVKMYIKAKRLSMVNELKSGGMSITEAADTAGFGDYSSFYRAYVGRYKQNPKA